MKTCLVILTALVALFVFSALAIHDWEQAATHPAAHTATPVSACSVNDATLRQIEYIVVTGYYSDWSLYQIGLTQKQLAEVTGVKPWELREAFPILPHDLRLEDLQVALKQTGQDITGCQILR